MNIEGLDKLDNAILEVIKDNARMSYSDIGEKVGLSRVAVKNRMETLEKKGVIQGYKTVIDEAKASDGVSFLLDIEAIPGEYQRVIDVLARDRFIRQIYSVTGECRIHCTGFAPNNRTLDSHVNHLFSCKYRWVQFFSTDKTDFFISCKHTFNWRMNKVFSRQNAHHICTGITIISTQSCAF